MQIIDAKITDATVARLARLAAAQPRAVVSAVTLSRCAAVTSDAILTSVHCTLQHMHAHTDVPIWHLLPGLMRRLSATHGGITELNLEGCIGLGNDAVGLIIEGLPFLTALNIRRCTVTERGVMGNCRRAENLSQLPPPRPSPSGSLSPYFYLCGPLA